MNNKVAEDAGNVKDLIRQAENDIGPDDLEDFRIRPTGFPQTAERAAPELASVLRDSLLIETAKRYQTKDAKARAAQRSLRHLANWSTWSVFTVTVVCALLASLSALFTADASSLWQAVVILLSGSALLGGALASWCLYRIDRQHLLRDWMGARASAESERLAYFERLVQRITESHTGNPRVMLLCLEFFRRYQLAVQQVYYTTRARDHGSSRKNTVIIGAIAVAILSVGSGGFGIWASVRPEVLPLAALGAIGSALAIVATRREELNQDERSAERYERTADALSHVRERHSAVQKAVARGEARVLSQYAAAVHEQLSLEHRQWLAETETIDTHIKELNASLNALGEK